METNEILEGNKLIAEFMGAKIGKTGVVTMPNGDKYFGKEMTMQTDRILNYHSSWDWLMPVVEKIDQIGARVTIGQMYGDIRYTDPLDQSKKFDIRIVSGVKINAINGAVIEFIKWYNENK